MGDLHEQLSGLRFNASCARATYIVPALWPAEDVKASTKRGGCKGQLQERIELRTHPVQLRLGIRSNIIVHRRPVEVLH